MDILTGLRTHVKGKEGVLRLKGTTDPDRRMTFELKSWYQFLELRGSKMKNTAVYLRGLFSQALEGCDDNTKHVFLSDLNAYLQSQDNQFDSKSLVAFVERLETLKTRPEILRQTPPAERTYGKQLLSYAEAKPWEYGSMRNKSKLGAGGEGTVYSVKVPISESSPGTQMERLIKVNTEVNKEANKEIRYSPIMSFQILMRKGDSQPSRLKK